MVDVYDAVLEATYNLTDPACTYRDITCVAPNDLRLIAASSIRSRLIYCNPEYVSYCGISGRNQQMDGIAYPGSGNYLYSKQIINDLMYKFKANCSDKTLVKDMGVVYAEFLAFTPNTKLTGSTISTTTAYCSRIYELDLINGTQSVLYNFYPSIGVKRSSGHDFLANGNILYSTLDTDQIFLFNTSEEHLMTWNYGGITSSPKGFAWDGSYGWIPSDRSMKLYKISLPNIPTEVVRKKWAFHRVGVRRVRL